LDASHATPIRLTAAPNMANVIRAKFLVTEARTSNGSTRTQGNFHDLWARMKVIVGVVVVSISRVGIPLKGALHPVYTSFTPVTGLLETVKQMIAKACEDA
jgi:hypothetical protein